MLGYGLKEVGLSFFFEEDGPGDSFLVGIGKDGPHFILTVPQGEPQLVSFLIDFFVECAREPHHLAVVVRTAFWKVVAGSVVQPSVLDHIMDIVVSIHIKATCYGDEKCHMSPGQESHF